MSATVPWDLQMRRYRTVRRGIRRAPSVGTAILFARCINGLGLDERERLAAWGVYAGRIDQATGAGRAHPWALPPTTTRSRIPDPLLADAERGIAGERLA